MDAPYDAIDLGFGLGMVLAQSRDRVHAYSCELAVIMVDRIAESRLLDVNVLLVSCDGDAEILGRVIAALRAQLPKELREAHARFDAGDASGLREKAHRLHGMLLTASTVVAMVASELEDEAASHRLETGAVLLARLDAMMAMLLTELAEVSIDDLLAARADDRAR